MTELAQLNVLAEKQFKAQDQVSELELALAKAKAALRDVSERELPELMEELEVTSFTSRRGIKIEIEEKTRASITAKNAGAAFEWLRAHGHGKLIRRTLSLIARTDAEALAIRESLCQWDDKLSDKPSVHHSTLAAFIRERLEAGADIPMDLFNVYHQRVAKIKL